MVDLRSVSFLCVGVLAACTGPTAGPRPPLAGGARADTSAHQAPMVTPEELTGVRGHVKLGAIRLMQDGTAGLVLHPDGTLDLPGEQRIVGRLERDGRVVDPQGKLMATFTEEGELIVGQDDYLPVTISADGVVSLLKEGRTVRLRDDGTLEGANPAGPKVTIEGFDPTTRRTAMLLLVLASFPLRRQP